jgi:hypothetical protein
VQSPTLALLLLVASTAPAHTQEFSDHFLDRTMRVDYLYTGGPAAAGSTGTPTTIVAIDRIVADGPWAGSRTRLVDDTGLGPYRFLIEDASDGSLLYSRGFSSIYAEWLVTPEARVTHRTFSASLRFPWPRSPVKVKLERRDPENRFVVFWEATVDPDSPEVNPAALASLGQVWAAQESGPPQEKVDLLLIGDGYTAAEIAKFHADARRLMEALFEQEPFRSRREDFNVWGLDLPVAESGVTRPESRVYRRNRMGTRYGIFGLERYMLTYENRTLRDIAAAAPYDVVVILVNDSQYGGGGIFNDHATVAVDSDFAEYVFVHEFAHHFAALADGYYSSDVAYETGRRDLPEPWEPNVTALHDPAALKWRDLVEPDTPIPTPWEKEKYDAHAAEIAARRQVLVERGASPEEFDALFREQKAWEEAFFRSQEYWGRVGAFEGANYETTGLFRPALDDIMFSRNAVGFEPVSQRAIERVIDLYSR